MPTPRDWPAPPAPEQAVYLPAPAAGAHRSLLVWLPGAYGRPQDAIERGFAADLAERHDQVSLLALPVDPFALTEGLALARFDAMLAPWRAAYRRIWLAGISLGALLVLGCLARNTPDIAGALALTPYLGNRALERDIRAAGSAAAWAAARPPLQDERALEEQVWRWLGAGGAAAMPVWLGLARSDRFYASQSLAHACWPDTRCLSVAGGHDWQAWRALWRLWLEQVQFDEEQR